MKRRVILFILLMAFMMVTASLRAQLPFSCPTTRTYYSYLSETFNSREFLKNEPINVTFNSDNSITVYGNTYAYSGKDGTAYVWKMNSDGTRYVMARDGSVFTHIMVLNVAGIVFDIRTLYTIEPMSPGATNNMQNSGGNYNGGGNTNTGTSSSRITCGKCHGKGRVIYNSYPPQYAGTKAYQKWCAECQQSYSSTLGHSHVTCNMCYGKGYTTR